MKRNIFLIFALGFLTAIPSGAQTKKEFEPLDIKAFNLKIAKAAKAKAKWVKDPMEVVFRLAGGFAEMKSKQIDVVSDSGEVADELQATITNEGLFDDSIAGERYKYFLKKDKKGVWKITKGQKGWRCWEGRGHTDYSAELCK